MATIVAAAGGGNWNATGTWVGGVVPTSSSDVQLDATSGNVTINVASACRSLDCTGYTGTLTNSGQILSIGTSTPGTGNIALKFVAGMTYTLVGLTGSAISFVSTSATQQTIDFAGKSTGNTTFNGAGGSWQLTSAHTMASANGILTLTAGALDLNGQTCSWGSFATAGATTRSLTMGAASVTLSVSGATQWSVAGSNLTITANTSTITSTLAGAAPGFTGGGFTYNNLVVNYGGTSAQTYTIAGANTFANLTATGAALKGNALAFSANQTVTGTLALNGNSSTNRILVQSDTLGTARTLTAATLSVSNADFQDITGAGAASWNLAAITGLSGDCGGNSGITFTTPTTQTSTGTASFTWSTHGWTTHVPLPQDTVVVNNAFIAARTVTMDMPRAGKDLDFSGATGNPTLSNSVANSVYGNIKFAAGQSQSGGNGFTFSGRGAQTITSAGVAFSGPLTFTSFGGTYQLQDNLANTASIALNNGTLDLNGKTVTVGSSFNSAGSLTRALNMSGATLLFAGTGTFWNVAAIGLTLTSASSTIKITTASASARVFAGGGMAYNTTLDYTVAGSTGSLTLTGANTFDSINFSDSTNARTLTLPSSTTTTISTNFNVQGFPGKLMTVNSSTSGTAATLSKTSGTVNCDYLSVKDITATGGATFIAGARSTNVSNNTGWTFAPFTRNQATGANSTSATTIAATFPNAVKAGDLLVCFWEGKSDTGSPSVSDSVNGAWTIAGPWANIPSSTKKYSFFFKTATAAATAGSMVVTVTPSLSSAGSQFMQIAEYSPASAYDSTFAANATQASGTPATILSNAPAGVGELMIMGYASDTQSNKTFTANSPLTSIVFDGAGKSANEAGGSQTLAMGELLYGPTTAITGSMGTGNGDDAGKSIIAFTPPTFTGVAQPAVSRIATNLTKTQAGISRIALPVTKTQSAIANISGGGTLTNTQPAVARIANAKTTTQPAISRIAQALTKTQPAISRIANVKTKTQPAISRVATKPTKTQSAVANIQPTGSFTKTQSAIASLKVIVTKTQPAVSRIARNVTKTQPATSRVARTFTTTQPGISRVARNVTKTQSAISSVKVIVTKTQGAVSRVANAKTRTQTAVATIGSGVLKTKTQPATSRIAVKLTNLQTAVSRIVLPRTKTQSAIARTGVTNTKTQPGISRIATNRTKTQSAITRLSRSRFKFQYSTAYVRQTQYLLHTPVIDGPARGLDRFWRNFHPQKVGVSILKTDGVYRSVSYPSQDEINAAEVAYLGGHEHYVSSTEATALTSAGYTVEAI